VAAGGRGLVCGAIRTTEGVVVATVVQEVAVRFTDVCPSADTV
jgi:acyl-CoA thioesterase